MSLIRLNTRKIVQNILPKARCVSHTSVLPEDEYTASPRYPQIQDLSHRSRLERRQQAVYDEIRDVKTVEEKQIKLNMPRYHGFPVIMLNEGEVPYNGYDFVRHVTRTHLTCQEDLPEFYKSIDVDEYAKDLRKRIEEAVFLEFEGIIRKFDITKEEISEKQRTDYITSSFVRHINRLILKRLYSNMDYISDITVDWDPRVEATWSVGGFPKDPGFRKFYQKLPWMEEFVDDPIDKIMYYRGCPSLALRSSRPLRPIVAYGEAEKKEYDVPSYGYDPEILGLEKDHKRMVNVPGFWAQSPDKFGILSYHNRGHLRERHNVYDNPNDDQEVLHYQAILASYAWLHAQANHLGFTTFNDITYPLVTQTVVTDGKLWSFYVYQMNTMLFCGKNYKENPKKNLCWATGELKLFEEIQGENIIGFNEDVLKKIIKLYVNIPEERLGINMTPYLGSDIKYINEYDDQEKREWLEREYKFLTSNRPRFKEIDEVYLWEKIYKIDHKTRFMDKKLRFFELFQRPEKRRLNDRLPRYIPRALRPDKKRHQGRYAKEFWP